MMAVSILTASPGRRIIALVIFVNLFVFALIAASLEGSYHQFSERAGITSRNMNRLVAEGIASDIDRIELGLKAVVDEAIRACGGRLLDGAEMNAFLARLQERLPMTDALRMANESGYISASPDRVPADLSVADRDYFTRLQNDPQAGLVISQPVASRVNGKWVLVFARRLLSCTGEFKGIVYASVAIDWFTQKFRALEVGPNGAVVMRGNASRDFDLLARFPTAGFVGQTKVSDTFRATISAVPHAGTYQARAGADSVLRTFSYQAVGKYPFITLVGLATEDYLGDWWREGVKLTALGLMFALATTVGGLAMLRTWRALELRTEELARSNADLEQFAYVSSHDLQTPLHNIVNFTQLLGQRYRGRLDEDADEFIGYIVNGAKRMSQMISDLHDYAQISGTGRVSVPVDLGAVVKAVLSRLATPLTAVGAEVRVGRLPIVSAEPLQMQRLFENLIDNAIRYHHPDRPLRIEIEAQPAGDRLWRLVIRDNGVGISPDYYERIFVIFQRLEPMKYPNGTGIGLAICRRIVYRFGGRIWIESEVGKGASFLFTLPGTGSPA